MIRDITIRPAANGFIVSVGCQTFVFENVAVLTSEIQRYLSNPEEREKHWMETAQNIKHTMGFVQPTLPSLAPERYLREVDARYETQGMLAGGAQAQGFVGGNGTSPR